ncbi:MAG: Wzz/FepE/Etk N-terminal domain-containing protein [Eubacteriales bacterium]|nr:Wzz/FepE/Etk N-terminal domain-containing protein [Eubacteriales bacterium]
MQEKDIQLQENGLGTGSMRDDDEIEIDLKQLFYEFRAKILVILLAGFLGAGLFGVYSKVVMQPVYTSTSMLYVLTKETTLTSLADLQIGSQLTQDYKELITSRGVMEQVIENLGLDMNVRTLERKITIENPSDTRILNISVTDNEPVMAKAITDEVASCASEYIAEIMEMDPPKIVETGEVPLYKTSPSVKRNTMLGGLLGMFIVMGIITLGVVMNDSIKTEDDVAKYLGLPVLAVVPEISAQGQKKASRAAAQDGEAASLNRGSRKKNGKGGRS